MTVAEIIETAAVTLCAGVVAVITWAFSGKDPSTKPPKQD